MRLKKTSGILKIASLFIVLAIVMILKGCTTLNPTYSISFVTIREADFRAGPVALPLDADGKKTILSFLEKGGDNSIDDYVDAGAAQFYDGLFKLLADEEFLYAGKFRKKGRTETIAPALETWFHKNIIYQLIDSRQNKPPALNPMCMTDGKYWWVFYMDGKNAGDKDFKVVKLLVTAAPSKTLKHYGKIKEDKPEKTYVKHSCIEKERTTGDLPDMHDKFLRQLSTLAQVYLVARLKTDKLGFTGKDMRIFIPDIHMLDREREKAYKYHSNHYPLLVRLMQEFITFKQEAAAGDIGVTVYQLGDFFDLWREIPFYWKKKKADLELEDYVVKMEEDRFDLYKLMRSPKLNVQFILGNHDFDIHNIEDYIDDELYYYFPPMEGGCPAGFTVHGDIFDSFEAKMPETIKHLAVHYYGPYVKGHTIDVEGLRKMIMDSHGKNQYNDYIQQPTPPHLGDIKEVKHSGHIPEANFNVKRVGVTKNKADLRFAKEAKTFAKMINDETGWNMKFAVVGHTHHARIVVDDTDTPAGFFALIDCGAWIQECSGSGFEGAMPSAQIGVIYNNDARVYQLKPKK